MLLFCSDARLELLYIRTTSLQTVAVKKEEEEKVRYILLQTTLARKKK